MLQWNAVSGMLTIRPRNLFAPDMGTLYCPPDAFSDSASTILTGTEMLAGD
jgi:hypothetical protein